MKFPATYDSPELDRASWLETARWHSHLALDLYRDWGLRMKEHAQKTVDDAIRDLETVFAIPIPDPVLGRERPLVLPDLLRAGHGPLVARDLKRALDELVPSKRVVSRLLGALRVFCRFMVDHPVLDGGRIDLTALYGRLVCPLNDGDIPKYSSRREYRLPTPAELPVIYDALLGWALAQRRKPLQAMRSVVMLISSFESALRGCEQRGLELEGQVFDRARDKVILSNPITVVGKGGVTRNVIHEPFGLDILSYWLGEVRPQYAPAHEGRFYPAVHGDPEKALSSSAFSESVGRPLAMLKERGLIAKEFTFHGARKTFATNYLGDGGTIPTLMGRGGWASAATLAHYVQPREETLSSGEEGFRRTLGRRR